MSDKTAVVARKSLAMPAEPGSLRPRLWPAVLLLLVAMAAVAYLPATRGGFIWDDDRYVSENPSLTHPAGLRAIWLRPGATDQYYPLVFTTFWIEHRLWGTNPAGYHWVNVVLHGLNAGLLWILLRRLRLPCPWLVAAVFALHPVHVESVAWISERKNVLSGFFYLVAFLAYLRFTALGTDDEAAAAAAPATAAGGSGLGWYAIAFTAFVAALLSKTVTCSLPAVLVLVTWWHRGWPTRREWAALAPMFVVGLALALHTAQMEKQHVGASGPDWAFSSVERCLIAGRALWFYAAKLVWPHPLIFIYERWRIDAGDVSQYLYPLAWAGLIAAVAWPAVRRPRDRAARGPLVAVLVFSGTLVPALGFFNVYPMLFSFVADHFQYLASIPLICLGTAAVDAGVRWLAKRASSDGRAAGAIVGAVLLVVLGGLTWRQGHAYAGLETLWRDTIAKNPAAWMAHYNLGRLLLDEGRDAEAIACFEQTVAVSPRHVLALNNWGHLLRRQAESAAGDEAARLYGLAAEKTTLAVDSDRTRDPRIIRNLAEIHMARRDYAAAVAAYERALAAIAGHDPKRGFGQLVPDYTRALIEARRLADGPGPRPGG